MEAVIEQLISSQGDLEGLQWKAFALAMLLSTLMGLALMKLYSIYFNDNEPQDGSLARSLVLLTPAFTATFWIVQSSIVLSLGLLGTLSFVRFRTPIKRAEDIAFVVIAIVVAISCATMQFLIAVIILSFLFAYSMIRGSFSTRLSGAQFAVLTINTKKTTSTQEIQKILTEASVKNEFVSSRTYDGMTSFVFNISKAGEKEHDALIEKVSKYDDKAHINFFYPNERLGA